MYRYIKYPPVRLLLTTTALFPLTKTYSLYIVVFAITTYIYILYSLIKVYKAKMRIKRNYIVGAERALGLAFGVRSRRNVFAAPSIAGTIRVADRI